MEVVQLPKSARYLLPEHAIADFQRWASLFADYLVDGGNKLLKQEETAVTMVQRLEQRLESMENKEIKGAYTPKKCSLMRQMHSYSYSYASDHYTPIPETSIERYQRKLREARETLADIQRVRREAEKSGDEVAKYMSWWDWFNSLDLEGMKREILRLEGNKVGSRVIENMLT